MANNNTSLKDKPYKIKCMVKKLKSKCTYCGNVDYIDLNLRFSSSCEMQPNIVYRCACSKCGMETLQSNLVTQHEQSILDALLAKGYHAEIDLFTRSIKGPFDFSVVNVTKKSMPYGWEYVYDVSNAVSDIRTAGNINPTPTMYTELKEWIEEYFPTNEYIEL